MSDHDDAARRAALAALARQPYTEARMRKLLGRRFENAAIDDAIVGLRRAGYLDDTAYARAFAQARIAEHGPRRIAADLRARGVDPSTVTTVLAAVTGGGARNAAANVLRRHEGRYAGLPEPVRRRRAYAMLARRGFDGDAIREALAAVFGDHAGGDD